MTKRTAALVAGILSCATAGVTLAKDWPQWRGPNRDARAADFKAPATWPTTLTQKWKVPVGEGVATPALVGDRLYVFSRQDGQEILRCLEAATGAEVWQDKYEAQGATGGAASFSGPRASPAVADGKVVTLGVRGMLSCLDAATGKLLWRKNDFQGSVPTFFVASSPLILDGMVIAQLGGGRTGAIAAYDLASGEPRWKWTGDSPAYASPVLMEIDGTKLIIAETEGKLLALNAASGKLAWEMPFRSANQRGYNAATPVVDGQTIIVTSSGNGVHAIKLAKAGDTLTGKEIWANPDKSTHFASPILKDGLVYGLSPQNELFCLDAKTGKTLWEAALASAAPRGPGGPGAFGDRVRPRRGDVGPGGPLPQAEPGAGQGRQGGPGRGGPGGGFGGRGDGMRGGGGFGSLVDAGSVIMALTPSSELVIFQPSDKQFTEQAKIKVSDLPTHAYPVLSGNRIFIKDQQSLILWTVE